MQVYTDGASNKNGSGWAVIVPSLQKIVRGDLPFGSTNQQAELSAIVQAVHCFGTQITIYTDSKYSIGCFKDWWQNWMRNGWQNSKKQPVKNDALIKFGLSLGANQVQFVHVRGHSGDYYNDMADYYASNSTLREKDVGWTIFNASAN